MKKSTSLSFFFFFNKKKKINPSQNYIIPRIIIIPFKSANVTSKMSKLLVWINILMIDEMEKRVAIVKDWKLRAQRWNKSTMRDVLRTYNDNDPFNKVSGNWKEKVPDLSHIINLKRLVKWYACDYKTPVQETNTQIPHPPQQSKVRQDRIYIIPRTPKSRACVKIQSFARRQQARLTVRQLRYEKKTAENSQIRYQSAIVIQKWFRSRGEVQMNLEIAKRNRTELKQFRLQRQADKLVNRIIRILKRNVERKKQLRIADLSNEDSVGAIARFIHNQRYESAGTIICFAKSKLSSIVRKQRHQVTTPRNSYSPTTDSDVVVQITIQEQQEVIQSEQLSRNYTTQLEQKVLFRRRNSFDLRKLCNFENQVRKQVTLHFLVDWLISHVRKKRRRLRSLVI